MNTTRKSFLASLLGVIAYPFLPKKVKQRIFLPPCEFGGIELLCRRRYLPVDDGPPYDPVGHDGPEGANGSMTQEKLDEFYHQLLHDGARS